MAAVCGIIFSSGAAKAEDPTPSEAAIAEMKKMLGGVSAEMQLYPESARAAGWEIMKAADFNKNTALTLLKAARPPTKLEISATQKI
jgi:hypothetical protein